MKQKLQIKMLTMLALTILMRTMTSAKADTTTLASLVFNGGLTHGTGAVTLRPGDTVIVSGTFYLSHRTTTMHVWTSSGHSFDPRPTGQVSYLNTGTSDAVFAILNNWQPGDLGGYIAIGIRKRSNLMVIKPVLEADGSVSYGYRVGDQPWDPWGHNVAVELYYAQGSTIIGSPIASHSLLTVANSYGWFNVPASQIPPVPVGADGVIAVVDRQDVIPESDEGDNRAVTPLPNLRVVAPSYDPSGDITYGYQIQRAYANTNQYVTLALYYADGPNVANIIPNMPPIHETTLNLNAGSEHLFELKHGVYPLPTPQARYLVALIDRDNKIREAAPGEADNIAATPCQVAPGYVQIAFNKGVGIYKHQTAHATFFATVVDLRNASIGQLADQYNFGRLGAWYDLGMTYNTTTRSLIAMINGTYFDYDWTDKLPTTMQAFPYGLKINNTIFDYGKRTSDSSNQPVLFTYNSDSAAILKYSKSLMDDSRYPNLIGAIAGTRTIIPAGAPRQWAGVRDGVGNGARNENRYRTIIFLTIPDVVSFATADSEMESFLGPNTNAQWAQLDGGGSTTLVVDRHALSSPTLGRLLPNVITIYGGK